MNHCIFFVQTQILANNCTTPHSLWPVCRFHILYFIIKPFC